LCNGGGFIYYLLVVVRLGNQKKIVSKKNYIVPYIVELICIFAKYIINKLKLLRKNKLIKLKKKNLGNTKLISAINKLIDDIEKAEWKIKNDILKVRSDADCVHSDGFYFFDINIHRTMILVALEENEAVVLWVGSHNEYETTFKNNKKTIEAWLRNQGQIK